MVERDALAASAANIDWTEVRRVLVVRLRSIGDTVLATPSLIALKRFLPHAEIDILLEDWVAPLLENHTAVDNVISVGRSRGARILAARLIRKRRYDVVFNLHGGTTATFFTRASGARHRIGYTDYQYRVLHNHLFGASSVFWGRPQTHSAEQQLALLGYVGVPVRDQPKSRLDVSSSALSTIQKRLSSASLNGIGNFALFHPAAAFATKEWPIQNFARTAEILADRGIATVAVAAAHESRILADLSTHSSAPIMTFNDLTLPEITALASTSRLFVGNDSGIAHIAAAVGAATVVIFGSSNRDHWRPWTDIPNEIVFREFACQPCPGYMCKAFGEPRCILTVQTDLVFSAIERVLGREKSGR